MVGAIPKYRMYANLQKLKKDPYPVVWLFLVKRETTAEL
jgi:hypothetical protein